RARACQIAKRFSSALADLRNSVGCFKSGRSKKTVASGESSCSVLSHRRATSSFRESPAMKPWNSRKRSNSSCVFTSEIRVVCVKSAQSCSWLLISAGLHQLSGKGLRELEIGERLCILLADHLHHLEFRVEVLRLRKRMQAKTRAELEFLYRQTLSGAEDD